jgi:hypothetical protein
MLELDVTYDCAIIGLARLVIQSAKVTQTQRPQFTTIAMNWRVRLGTRSSFLPQASNQSGFVASAQT